MATVARKIPAVPLPYTGNKPRISTLPNTGQTANAQSLSSAPPAGSTHLTFSQIMALWISAGGSAALAPIMAAIATAESGGNYAAFNGNASTGDYSVGLWQINYFGSLLGPRTQRYGSPAYLRADPQAQAKAAVDLAAGGKGLGNWTTYGGAAFRNALAANAGAQPAQGFPGPQDISVWSFLKKTYGPYFANPGKQLSTSPIDPGALGKDASGALNSLIPNWINTHNTARAGQAIAGFVLVVVGLIILARDAGGSPAAVVIRDAGSTAASGAREASGAASQGARRARGRATPRQSRRVRGLRTSPGVESFNLDDAKPALRGGNPSEAIPF